MLQARGSGLPDADKPDGQRIQMLTNQNNKLSAQLEVQRKEIATLEAKVSQMENKQLDYEQTLSCVDRLWTQLNDDILFLARRSALDKDSNDKASTSGQEHHTSNGRASGQCVEGVSDPFLLRLVHNDSAAAKVVAAKVKELTEDATEVETALLRRSETTKACLAHLLDLQRQQEQRIAELACQLGSNAGPAIQEEVERAMSEAAAARRELDAQKAINRALDEQQRTLDDQRMKDEVTIRDLTNELADRSEQVATMQRKLLLARTNSVADGASLQSGLVKPEVKQELSASRPQENHAEGALDAEENRKLLEKREAELDAEKESNMKLQRDMRELQDSIAKGSFVPESQLYQQAQRDIHAAREDVERQKLLINTLQQERAGLQSRQQNQELQVKQGEHAMRMLAIAKKHEQDLEMELQQARTAANDADLRWQKERHRMGQTKTLAELQQYVEALLKEKKVLQANVDLHKAAADRAEEARQEAQSALSTLKAKEIQMEHLQRQLTEKDRAIQDARTSEDEAKVKAQDMQLFVEVLLNCNEEPRDVVDLRTAEARLQAQVDSLQSRLDGPEHQAALNAFRQSEVNAKQEAEALRRENDNLRLESSKLERQVAEMQAELSSAKETSAAYVQEIEMISEAFEELQKQNTRLLQQVAERDEVSNQLVTERIKSGHAAASHKQEQAAAGAARQRAEQAAALLQERVNDLHAKLQASIEETSALRERAHVLAAQLEGAAREAREATEALRAREAALDAAQKTAAERKRAADDEADRLARERVKRQRLEEDVKVANSKVERLRRGGGGGGDAEELEAMRTLLRCNVCHERQKDVIITKCWHIFCSHCIRKNLETRNRKCPGCGAAFGQHDVKQFFFT